MKRRAPGPVSIGATSSGVVVSFPASGTGDGGVWLDWDGNDFPTAPSPMDDFDDDRVRTMAGDLDAQLAALVQEVTQ